MSRKNPFKVLAIIIFLLLSFLSFKNNVMAASYSTKSNLIYTLAANDIGTTSYSFCKDTNVLSVFVIFGMTLKILKIVVPLILLIMGTITFGKAALASDAKATNQAASEFAKKAILAVAIFFIPLIINFVFSLAYNIETIKEKFQNCEECFTDPTGSKCQGLVKK